MSPAEQKEMLSEFNKLEGTERLKFIQRLQRRLFNKEEFKQGLKLAKIFCDECPEDVSVLRTVLDTTQEVQDVKIIAEFRKELLEKIEILIGPIK